MFNKFSRTEKRYILELINSISQIDGTFTDEEGCILAAVAYLMEIDLEVWTPNLVDISLSYYRVGQMGKHKIEKVIILLMQVSIFDGIVKHEELATILPLAYEAGITDEEMLDLGRRAFSGNKFTEFDKLLVYALCVKMMEVDYEVNDSEKKELAKIQKKFKLPPNFIDRQLVNNISWALNIMAGYKLDKRYKIIRYVTTVRDSDNLITEHESTLLLQILRELGYKDFEGLEYNNVMKKDELVEHFNELKKQGVTTWESWLDFVKEIYYDQYHNELDEYLVEALNNAFEYGLTMEEDKYYYLEAKRILSNIYFHNKNFKPLNKILKEIQQLEMIPKWYWSIISKLDFDQLSHGIAVKNERLLSLVEDYSRYGDDSVINLLSKYPNFMKQYKDYKVVKDTKKLEKSKIAKITGLQDGTKIKVTSKNEEIDNKRYTGTILILGSNKGKKKENLIQLAKDNGFDGELIFGPDYDELTNLGIEKYRNSSKYDVIFIAESPHSARGIGEKSSILKRLANDEFPPSIALRAKNNKLSLTYSAFKEAILKSRKFLKITIL